MPFDLYGFLGQSRHLFRVIIQHFRYNLLVVIVQLSDSIDEFFGFPTADVLPLFLPINNIDDSLVFFVQLAERTGRTELLLALNHSAHKYFIDSPDPFDEFLLPADAVIELLRNSYQFTLSGSAQFVLSHACRTLVVSAL